MKELFENWRQYTKEISETTLLEEVEKEENQSVLVENDRIRAKLARDIKRREKRIEMKRKRLERAKKKRDGAKAFKIKKDIEEEERVNDARRKELANTPKGPAPVEPDEPEVETAAGQESEPDSPYTQQLKRVWFQRLHPLVSSLRKPTPEKLKEFAKNLGAVPAEIMDKARQFEILELAKKDYKAARRKLRAWSKPKLKRRTPGGDASKAPGGVLDAETPMGSKVVKIDGNPAVELMATKDLQLAKSTATSELLAWKRKNMPARSMNVLKLSPEKTHMVMHLEPGEDWELGSAGEAAKDTPKAEKPDTKTAAKSKSQDALSPSEAPAKDAAAAQDTKGPVATDAEKAKEAELAAASSYQGPTGAEKGHLNKLGLKPAAAVPAPSKDTAIAKGEPEAPGEKPETPAQVAAAEPKPGVQGSAQGQSPERIKRLQQIINRPRRQGQPVASVAGATPGGAPAPAKPAQTHGQIRRAAREAGDLTYTYKGKKYGTRGRDETPEQWKKKMARNKGGR